MCKRENFLDTITDVPTRFDLVMGFRPVLAVFEAVHCEYRRFENMFSCFDLNHLRSMARGVSGHGAE